MGVMCTGRSVRRIYAGRVAPKGLGAAKARMIPRLVASTRT